MATTAETLRAYHGPAIFSFGFRPFFLFGAVWAAVAMGMFTLMLHGMATLPTTFDIVDWHVHELLFGFLPAIVAGFLLTAVPNWTGRLPVAGGPLIGLFVLWLLGRGAVAASALIGAGPAMAVDVAFLAALAALIGQEILAGNNLKNLPVLLLVIVLGAGNLAFHLEAMAHGVTDLGRRVGLAAIVLLISLIGGRVVPSFTRNWLVKRSAAALPAPFGRLDLAALALGAIALGLWLALPEHALTGAALAAAGVLHTVRLGRWKGWLTLAEPLVTILHIGYAFVPLGFLFLALSILDVVGRPAAVHAWTSGAIGVMTLAVMTRASLGHTGRPLTASPAIVAIYAAAVLGALARLIAAFGVAPISMLSLAALGWSLAFFGFAVVFGPILVAPRAG